MPGSGTLPGEVHAKLDAAAERDPYVRDVLERIAGLRHRHTRGMDTVARQLNADRAAELRAAFIADALTSRQVAELLGVADHRAVAARRSRHTLLGWTIGNETYHPAWQFTDAGLVPGADTVVRALAEVTSSPLIADRIMRRERDDLEGRSLGELLAEGRTELVVRLISATDV